MVQKSANFVLFSKLPPKAVMLQITIAKKSYALSKWNKLHFVGLNIAAFFVCFVFIIQTGKNVVLK